jgi:hypothetical protein
MEPDKTEQELLFLRDGLESLKPLMEEIDAELRKGGHEKLAEILQAGFGGWGRLYELPFLEHLALALVPTGLADTLREAANTGNPIEHLREALDDEAPELDGMSSDSAEVEQAAFFLLIYSLSRSMESALTYGAYLNDLVRSGNDEDLFKAVSVDRCSMGAEPIADRIAWAQLKGESAFFDRLAKALRGPTARINRDLATLRLALIHLHDTGQLESFSKEEAYVLLAQRTGLYPIESKEDPAEGLWKFIQRWKKTRRTSFEDLMSSQGDS